MNNNIPLNLSGSIREKNKMQPAGLFKLEKELTSQSSHSIKYEPVPEDRFEEYKKIFLRSSAIAIDVIEVKNVLKNIIVATDTNVGFMMDYQYAKQFDENINQFLSDILSDKHLKIVKNGKQLLKTLYNSGIMMNGQLFDLFIAESMLKAGKEKLDDFKSLLKEYCGTKFISRINYNYTLTEKHVDEVAREVNCMFALKEKMEEKLNQLLLKATAQLEFKCIYSILNLENAGVKFDVVKYRALLEVISQHKEKLEEENTYLDKIEIQQDIVMIENVNPEIVRNYKKTLFILQRYNEEFLKCVGPDSRIHPVYSQNDSNTGRVYCSNPNLQQFPRDKRFRECIIPVAGCKFIIADYSQIELRIAAEISNDETMIKAFQNKQDIHRITASSIIQKDFSDITDEERRAAKAVNFGLLYGMSSERLQRYAMEQYQISLTLEEAENFKQRFFENFKGIRAWQQQCSDKRYRKVTRTLNGRRRVWPDNPKPTEMLNTPIQGTEADILKLALIKLDVELKAYDANVVLIVHDEIIVEVAEDKAEEVKDILVKCMEEAGQALLTKVPIEVEAVIAHSWAEK